jgi:hypothetical protein
MTERLGLRNRIHQLLFRLNRLFASKSFRIGAVLITSAGVLAALGAYYVTGFLSFRPFLYIADVMTFPTMYNDLAAGYGLAQWSLSPVLYIFPEGTLFFLMRWLAGNLHVGIVLFGLSQILAFALGLLLLAKQLFNSLRVEYYVLIALAGTLFFRTLTALYPSAQWYMTSQLHFGVTVVWPYAFALALASLKLRTTVTKRAVLSAVLLVIILFVTTFSDWFAVIQITVPLIGAAFLLFLLKKTRLKPVLTVTALVVSASAAGCLAFLATPVGRIFTTYAGDRSSTGEDGLANFLHVFRELTKHYPLHAVLIAVFAGLCAIVLINETRNFVRHRQTSPDYIVFFATAFLIILVINPLAVIVTGIFKNTYEMRYLHPLVLLPAWWGWPLIAVYFIPPRRLRIVAFGSLCICAGLLPLNLITVARHSNVTFDAYYPENVQCLDENATRLGLQDQYGLAHYSQAKTLTLLSKANLHLIQSDFALRPAHWVNQFRWDNMEPEFVVTDLSIRDIPPDPVRKAFGEPAAMFICQNLLVMVYNRPGDTAFRQQLKNPVPIDSRPHTAIPLEKPGDSIDFEAATLPGMVGQTVGWNRQVEGGPPGVMTYGPYLSLPAGAYSFEITYSAESQLDNVGWWDVMVSEQEIKKAPLPTQQTVIQDCFSLATPGQVQIRTVYEGAGKLTIEKIRIVKAVAACSSSSTVPVQQP